MQTDHDRPSAGTETPGEAAGGSVLIKVAVTAALGSALAFCFFGVVLFLAAGQITSKNPEYLMPLGLGFIAVGCLIVIAINSFRSYWEHWT